MKHILITGGSDGLGKVTAQKLVATGHTVTILSHNAEKTKTAATEIGCAYVVADVNDAAAVAKAVNQAVEQNGAIDTLINNAGVWILGPLETNTSQDIERAVAVNALGTIYCTHAVVPGMKRRGKGRIINVISQGGLYAKAERSVYTASKWAITGFTKCMQAELKPAKVSVTGFYPGAMDTGLFAKVGDTKDRTGELSPAVAADALVYLCNVPDDVDVPEYGVQSLAY